MLYSIIDIVTAIFNVSYWPAPPTIHRGLEWPQCLNSDFVYLIVCLSVDKYSHFSPHPPLFPSFILLSPLSPLLLISKKFPVMNPK